MQVQRLLGRGVHLARAEVRQEGGAGGGRGLQARDQGRRAEQHEEERVLARDGRGGE